MANGALTTYDCCAPYCDVLGTETNWMPNGKWQPMTDAELCFRRALSYQKPYCFLMNTHFADFTLELTERYMQRALAYGMFPGFFSENAATDCYFANPKYYEPARPLFKKYIPLIRTIAKAGWEPITFATSNNPKVYVERFGGGREVFFTALNDSDKTCAAKISLDINALELKDKTLTVRELISGTELKIENESVVLDLKPEQAALINIAGN